MQFIEWMNIDLKGKTSGSIKTICPLCSEHRKKQKDPCLSVSLDEGLAKCWHCEAVSVRDYKENKAEKNKSYATPKGLNPHELKKDNRISDKVLNYFAKRGITKEILDRNYIISEQHYQPSLSKTVENIVFPYYELSTLVNKKYRSGCKCFTQTRGAKKIFYGINDIIGHDEFIITEGEIDKLSFDQVGFINSISLPNGGNDLTNLSNYMEPLNHYVGKNVKKIIIAVDNDVVGKSMSNELVKRFGRWRCAVVEYPDGCKDANEVLMLPNGKKKLQEMVKNAKLLPVDGVFSTNDLKKEIIAYYDNPNKNVIYPNSEPFQEFNKIFKLIEGQLTVVTGIPSHGKSSFIEWYIFELVRKMNKKVTLFSPEHFPLERHQAKFATMAIGKPFGESFNSAYQYDNVERMSKDELLYYIEWANNKIYLNAPEEGKVLSWDGLTESFDQQIFRYGIDIIVIDAFNKFKKRNDSLDEINRILASLVYFAQSRNVSIFLVAHPTKMRKSESEAYQVPDLYDIKGSSDFRDQVHNGICVYRRKQVNANDETEVIVQKVKDENIQGKIGEVATFKYDMPTKRFFDKNQSIIRGNLIKKQTTQTELGLEHQSQTPQTMYDDENF